MKRYVVVEIFRSIQGEGAHAGKLVVFCRFRGCNSRGACSKFGTNWCDTNFDDIKLDNNGGEYNAQTLIAALRTVWGLPGNFAVVLTGGEPLLQVDTPLIDALILAGLRVHIETNGTLPIPEEWKSISKLWVTCSPKLKPAFVRTNHYDELKVIFPAYNPEEIAPGDSFPNAKKYIQPLMVGDNFRSLINRESLRQCLVFIADHPQWSLSLQMHKVIGVE